MSTDVEGMWSSKATASEDPAAAHRLAAKKKKVLYVRPWNGITSTPEAYAIVRGLERRYGRLRWYQFLRDQEVKDMYQPFFFAELEDEDSLEMIPLGRLQIQLEIPIFERAPPGGNGLQDIGDLLSPESKVEHEVQPEVSIPAQMAAETAAESDSGEEKPTTRTIAVWIERSATRLPQPEVTFTLTGFKKNIVHKAFAEWGGFYQPPPPPQPQSEEDAVFNPPPPPEPVFVRKHMDAIISQWAPTIEAERREREEARKAAAAAKAAAEASEKPVVEATPVVEVAPAAEAEPEPAPEPEPEPEPTPAQPVQPRISKRRERLLALARQNAQKPLPAELMPLTPKAKEQIKLEQEEKAAKEEEMKNTVRDRLWKLMGGKWF